MRQVYETDQALCLGILVYKPEMSMAARQRRVSNFSLSVAARQRQMFSRDGHLCYKRDESLIYLFYSDYFKSIRMEPNFYLGNFMKSRQVIELLKTT